MNLSKRCLYDLPFNFFHKRHYFVVFLVFMRVTNHTFRSLLNLKKKKKRTKWKKCEKCGKSSYIQCLAPCYLSHFSHSNSFFAHLLISSPLYCISWVSVSCILHYCINHCSLRLHNSKLLLFNSCCRCSLMCVFLRKIILWLSFTHTFHVSILSPFTKSMQTMYT